jgi:hypothetical protein
MPFAIFYIGCKRISFCLLIAFAVMPDPPAGRQARSGIQDFLKNWMPDQHTAGMTNEELTLYTYTN